MQGLRQNHLVFVITGIFLLVLFVGANRDLCGSVFKTQVGYALLGHVMTKTDVLDEFECQLKCMGNGSCKSFNVHHKSNNTKRICELNNITWQMNPDDFKQKKGSTYFGSVQATCVHVFRENNEQINGSKCRPGYKGERCQIPSKSCLEIYKSGYKMSGVYYIDPDGLGEFKVFCDQTTAGGGWTVFQKRFDGTVDFFRTWDDYRQGFGNLNGEFWLGLDKIYRLTASSSNKLRVDLEDVRGGRAFAEYQSFSVANEEEKYLLILGSYSGSAGDSLAYHRGLQFSSKDQDNDRSQHNCASSMKGGWWYNSCQHSNLNGLYRKGQSGSTVMRWNRWRGSESVERSEMKVRQNDS